MSARRPRIVKLLPTSKARSSTTMEGAPALTSPSGEGAPGMRFGAAAKDLVENKLDMNEFVGKIYGNLLAIDRKVLTAKVEKLSKAFPKLVISITWLLREGATERKGSAYERTRREASVLSEWRELLKKNPHQWPTHPIYLYVLELRHIFEGVNKATTSSLSNGRSEWFQEWSDVDKVLLPSPEPLKFIGLDREKAFPHLKDIYDAARLVILEFTTPPYGWRVAIATNTKKLFQAASFPPDGVEETLRKWAQTELCKQYLTALHVIDHRLNYAILLPELAFAAPDDISASGLMRSILQKRDIATKVFGKDAVEDLDDVYKTVEEEEKKDPTAFTREAKASIPPQDEFGVMPEDLSIADRACVRTQDSVPASTTDQTCVRTPDIAGASTSTSMAPQEALDGEDPSLVEEESSSMDSMRRHMAAVLQEEGPPNASHPVPPRSREKKKSPKGRVAPVESSGEDSEGSDDEEIELDGTAL